MKKFSQFYISIFLIIFCIFLSVTIYFGLYVNKIYPNTLVASYNVGGKTSQEALDILTSEVKKPEKITLTSLDKKYEIDTKTIALEYDLQKSVERAYNSPRTGNFFYDLSKRIKSLYEKEDLGLVVTFDDDKLLKFISVTAEDVSLDPIYPSISVANQKVVVTNGKKGNKVDALLLRSLIGEELSHATSGDIVVPVIDVDPTLTPDELNNYQKRGEAIKGKSLSLKFEFFVESVSGQKLLDLIDPKGEFKKDKIKDIALSISQKINREPQEPKFVFENEKVKEFAPAKTGVETKTEDLQNEIVSKLNDLEKNTEVAVDLQIPITSKDPQVTTDKVNNLGINTLIGRGTSKYKGSIPSRIHNVATATTKINGILIKPGETLSFNDALGDVSKFTGYQAAYVIKEGKTVLGDGGGVCQVSTTLFRAALNAGLEIKERRAHAYRVGYYEQDGGPGLDATVYSPSPDLKITNNTPAHILIQATADSKNQSLVFELYGTSDGRVSEVSKPIVTNVTQPGPDVYVDDPTLPNGTVKQTEHRANGAKVVFNYKVTRDGKTLIDTKFTSSYRPWTAVYLKGTGPIN